MHISEVTDLACINHELRELHSYGSKFMKESTQNGTKVMEI